MLSVLLIFFVLALFLSVTGWMLFLVLSMDAVYREAKEQYWAFRGRSQRKDESEERLIVAPLPPDVMWEDHAVVMWRDGRALSAIELVQQQTSVSFEEVHVKLLKLDEESAPIF